MEITEEIEHFFGVYLLYCINPKFKGRTYIGYTVDPKRRIKQHNAGRKHGGAWKTNSKRPWTMVLIIHGFPNSTAALRFEWAWQHPQLSRRLKHVEKKKSRQRVFEYALIVLSEMLHVGPWCRLPLTIRWLDLEFYEKYCSLVKPLSHMPMCYGKVISKKVNKNNEIDRSFESAQSAAMMFCSLCGTIVKKNEVITCIKPKCILIAHLICLGKVFSPDGMLVPVKGTCPACDAFMLWGDLIRKKNGCYAFAESNSNDDELLIFND